MSETDRLARLLPAGEPRWVRVYRTDAPVADPWTVLFVGKRGGFGVNLSANPAAPNGVACHFDFPGYAAPDCEPGKGWAPAVGRKTRLGTRVPFSALPEACRALVLREYREAWGL